MVNDYAKMTTQELEALSIKLMEQKAVIRVEQRKLNAEIAKKTAEENAKKRVSVMSSSKKRVLR